MTTTTLIASRPAQGLIDMPRVRCNDSHAKPVRAVSIVRTEWAGGEPWERPLCQLHRTLILKPGKYVPDVTISVVRDLTEQDHSDADARSDAANMGFARARAEKVAAEYAALAQEVAKEAPDAE